MADQSSGRTGRRVWTPEVVDEQTAIIRTLGPSQGAAAAELRGELLQIAERALNDQPAAERIVATVLQTESDLVTTALRAMTPDHRQEARDALARAVRRAVLDSLPPVLPAPAVDRHPRYAAPGVGATRRLRPVQIKNITAKSETTEGPAGERPAAVPAKAAANSSWRRAGSIVIGAGLLLMAGWTLWDSLLRPTADEAAPTQVQADAAPLALSPAPVEAEPLQLEADEPTGRLLRQLPPAEAAPSALTGAEAGADTALSERQRSTAAASSSVRPIDMSAVAVSPPAAAPAGLALPAGGSNLRIFILYPAGGPAVSEASALYADLSRSGQLPLVVLRDVSFAIVSPRIRYFHAADAGAAGALADFLVSPRGEWQVQNFGHIRPLPVPGTVEIYVPPA